jgi:WD40 repeat protein
MFSRYLLTVSLLLGVTAPGLRAQQGAAILPVGDEEPLLRLEPGGPSAFVTSLAFSPDGKTLYAGGFDKVVRVWKLNEQKGEFEIDKGAAYRIPIGGGSYGVINAIALSPDGTQLAVGGAGAVREGSGFKKPGYIVPKSARMSDAMRQDEGTIYVFDTRTGKARFLRGHRGAVVSLAFAPAQTGKPPLLASAGREWDATALRYHGGVRLWDTSKFTEVDQFLRKELPDPYAPPVRPGLALRHTGNRVKEVQVALAWDDGQFRIWDVDRGVPQVATDGDPRRNNTVQFLPDGSALTTSGRQNQGRLLRTWTTPPGQQPQLTGQSKELPTLVRGRTLTYYEPWALTLASSRGDGVLDSAAVVLAPERGEKYRLMLYGITNDNFGFDRLRQAVLLWPSDRKVPVVATTPKGRYLAVAGGPDHEILVFSIDALLNGAGNPQVLRGNGTMLRHVAFVQKGNAQGLLLNERWEDDPAERGREPRPGDLIFDIQERKLSKQEDARDWQTAVALLDGWRVKFDRPPQNVLTVLNNEQPVGKPIRLVATKRATAQALLPPANPGGVPLLAVAFDEVGDRNIVLYNVLTGEELRWFSGHVNDVRTLAFSRDGRMLVSAAEDQTVCVWSLSNLGEVLGKLGLLRGVEVQEEDAGNPGQGTRLVVTHLDENILEGANFGKLQRGEVVLGKVLDGQFVATRNVRDFYDTFYKIKPGERVTLRLRDRTGRARDVALVLSQGADERKPLISLFVQRPDAAAVQAGLLRPREWFAWNPFGYYEASSIAVESNLGWHFNTRDPETLTRFAPANQVAYRDAHYIEGILPALVKYQDLTRAVADRRPPLPDALPRPDLALLIDGADDEKERLDAAAMLPLRAPPRTLRLTIDNFKDYLKQIKSAEWRVNDGPWTPFRPGEDTERTADLGDAIKQPGIYTFEARVIAQARITEQSFITARTARYQLPRPTIEFSARPTLDVQNPAYVLPFEVRPGQNGQAFQGELVHRHNGAVVQTVPVNSKDGQPFAGKAQLQLRQGDNQIELEVANTNPLKDFEGNEKDVQKLTVRFTPRAPVPAPTIALSTVVPLSDDNKEGAPQTIEPGKPLIVSVPRVRVRGKITAQGAALSAATVRKDDAANGSNLANFKPNVNPEAVLDEELVLDPGSHKYRFAAKTAQSSEGLSAPLEIDYRPPLPEIVVNRADIPPEVFRGEAVRLSGELRLPPKAKLPPFELNLLVNGKPTGQIVPQGAAWTAEVRLEKEGPNEILVQAKNRWQTRPVTSEPVNVVLSYMEGVSIIKAPPGEVSNPIIDLTARVVSPSEVKADRVIVEVGGEQVACAVAVTEEKQKPNEPRSWIAEARGVRLRNLGKNEVRVRVSDAYGASREPKVLSIVYQPRQPPDLPRVELAGLPTELRTSTSDLPVTIRVHSNKALQSLQVVRSGRFPMRQDINLAAVKPVDGVYEVKERITLAPNENRLVVRAANADGEGQPAAYMVNYLRRPVRLVVDALEPTAPGGAAKVVRASYAADNTLQFDDVPAEKFFAPGRLLLRGRVAWDRELDDLIKELSMARVYVNGFQQLPALLEKPATDNPRERSFLASILLNKTEKNEIEIELPVPIGSDSRTRFVLNCREPIEGKRLHLLAIGVGNQDEQPLLKRVLKALRITMDDKGDFLPSAFANVQVHGILAGPQVDRRAITSQLHLIGKKIEQLKANDVRASVKPLDDLVLVYYQGGELLTPGAHYLNTSSGAANDRQLARTGITISDLRKILHDMSGAPMLLLDVIRAVPPAPEKEAPVTDRLVSWPREAPRIGVMRSRLLSKVNPTPEEDRLIQELEAALRKQNVLREVVDFLVQKFKAIAAENPQLRFDKHVPDGLLDLVVALKP